MAENTNVGTTRPSTANLNPTAAAEKERRRKLAAQRAEKLSTARRVARNRAANPRNPREAATSTTAPKQDYYNDPTGMFRELSRR